MTTAPRCDQIVRGRAGFDRQCKHYALPGDRVCLMHQRRLNKPARAPEPVLHRVTHYTERLRIVRGNSVTYIGGEGYPVCVSGDRAYKIKAVGNTTDNRLSVTCAKCRLAIKHEIEGNL